MEKRFELADASSCLNKAEADEPLFVLRANDPVAAQCVRLWKAMAFGIHEEEKLHEADDLARQMDGWRESRPKVAEELGLRG